MGCVESAPKRRRYIAPQNHSTAPLLINESMLQDCHCCYSPDGVLKFEAGWKSESRSPRESEREYEHLCNYISAYVKSYLFYECQLQVLWLPGGKTPDSGVDIFVSKDWEQNTSTALVIIPGSGKVTLGQWSRGLCKDIGLRFGTVKSYIDHAYSLGWSVLIMNPNIANSLVKENRSNTLWTWSNFVSRSPAQKICIVAHSYGGTCTCHIANECLSDFQQRVAKIAFTDSVHSRHYPHGKGLKPEVAEILRKQAINWARSDQPLDQVLGPAGEEDVCECRSAGHPVHEYTSEFAVEAVFAYLSQP